MLKVCHTARLSRSQPPSESVPPFELWLPASCFLADRASKTESQARVLWISSAFKHSSWPKQLCLYRIFVWHFVLHLSDRDWWMELDVIVSMCGYWCSSKQPEPRQNVQIYVGASYVVCFALAHFQPQSPRFQCATAGELAPSGNDRKKSKLGWLGYALWCLSMFFHALVAFWFDRRLQVPRDDIILMSCWIWQRHAGTCRSLCILGLAEVCWSMLKLILSEWIGGLLFLEHDRFLADIGIHWWSAQQFCRSILCSCRSSIPFAFESHGEARCRRWWSGQGWATARETDFLCMDDVLCCAVARVSWLSRVQMRKWSLHSRGTRSGT